MADFATLSDLKTALGISSGDTTNDALLTTLTGVATDMIIDYLNRDPRADDFVEATNGLGSPEILVNQYPINSVASITIGTTNPVTVPADQIQFDENLIWLTNGWCPRGRKNVTVSYNAGLDPMPKSFKQAAIYTVRALLTSQKVDLNATGDSWAGVSSQAWYAGGAGVVPQSAMTLLTQYVKRVAV